MWPRLLSRRKMMRPRTTWSRSCRGSRTTRTRQLLPGSSSRTTKWALGKSRKRKSQRSQKWRRLRWWRTSALLSSTSLIWQRTSRRIFRSPTGAPRGRRPTRPRWRRGPRSLTSRPQTRLTTCQSTKLLNLTSSPSETTRKNKSRSRRLFPPKGMRSKTKKNPHKKQTRLKKLLLLLSQMAPSNRGDFRRSKW